MRLILFLQAALALPTMTALMRLCAIQTTFALTQMPNEPPYIVTFDCWNNTFATTGPDCGHHVRCPPGGSETEWMLEVKGEHFNTGQVDLQVLSGPSIIYSTTVTAVAGNSGKLAGSFDVKTSALCPGRHAALGVKLTDGCTGKVVQLSYPAE